MLHPIKYIEILKETPLTSITFRIGIKRIVNIMNNRNELIYTGVTGIES